MVVRMRSTRSHTGNRRSHHALKTPVLAVCKNCGAHHRQHHMCLVCGFYKGRIVLDMKAKQVAREEKIKQKKSKINAQDSEVSDVSETKNDIDTTKDKKIVSNENTKETK